ncbi:hypothetical protein G6F50_017416 [Rhizopus delemar]|uniref:Uncharacterized protein n=1 Tax=Rhizopus delemar TaxID=936053 RepID=A0A9P6XQD6_9FUNG|nr:hypothetical protein G6F50_017416 [Rhizopus delemar]
MAVLAVEQDHAGGGHVQRQPQHGGDKQHDREDGEGQRALHGDHRQQHHQRDGDVEAGPARSAARHVPGGAFPGRGGC